MGAQEQILESKLHDAYSFKHKINRLKRGINVGDIVVMIFKTSDSYDDRTFKKIPVDMKVVGKNDNFVIFENPYGIKSCYSWHDILENFKKYGDRNGYLRG